MEKTDFKKVLKSLYTAPIGRFVDINVPHMQFVKVDGEGDPNAAPAYAHALKWLYGTSYAIKFASKAQLEKDYVVPPLEGLWWADDPRSFVARRKSEWCWTMMIMAPDFITTDMFEAAVTKTAHKLGSPPASLRFECSVEGPCLQAMHIGSYDEEGPLLAELHNKIMPEGQFEFNGPHHEIYLGDPRKTESSRLRTLLRQPVKCRV